MWLIDKAEENEMPAELSEVMKFCITLPRNSPGQEQVLFKGGKVHHLFIYFLIQLYF